MYQIPVNDLTKLRKARKRVKIALKDIGLEYCKEAAKEFKDFNPGENVFNETAYTDICVWHPSYSKTQNYRSRPYCCRECQFSSATYAGYKNHFRHAHKRLIQDKVLLNCSHCTFVGNKRTLEIHVGVFHKDKLEQEICRIKQRQAAANKCGPGASRSLYFCKKCTYRDSLYNSVRKHIYREHFKHVAAPYLRMIPKSSLPNGGASFNGDNILCKRCKFTTKTYESLVQHVIEYHERAGAQVTAAIGHANVTVSNLPSMSQKSSMILNGGSSPAVGARAQPVIGYLKPSAPALKSWPSGAGAAAVAAAADVNTSQTQKWKICTVCNELFPETLYSAHFESAHKARIVWAMAKYIMKIHNFTSKCLLCNRYLPSDTLLNHLLVHGITCPQCHSAFHGVEKLLEHERLAHLKAFVGPPGSAQLTFDLAIKQNVQLHVLTFNMNESEGKDKGGGPPGKAPPSLGALPDAPESAAGDAADGGRAPCPLCCAPVKEAAPDALALHLRQRHQVLRTMHPVEKKMTYKCIHCLGVYTSNMVASTITLHLVQCRAVGRKQAALGAKSPSGPDSSGAPAAAYAKKIKLSAEAAGGREADGKNNRRQTFEARQKFLRSYFNRRPYLSPAEEKKLSASLWMWKSHICKHFAAMQKECKSRCQKSNASVLLGFDMQALQKVRHRVRFQAAPRDQTAPAGRPGRLKAGIPNVARSARRASSAPKNACAEPILIDSDSEPEIVKTNGDLQGKPTQTSDESRADLTPAADRRRGDAAERPPLDSTEAEEKPPPADEEAADARESLSAAKRCLPDENTKP
ncbi:activity-dependent neuroprotective protein a isoform X2 [Hippocampus zosterae]|nr:activity-dependent neuroprotective protein a isoform X2 [Hippocampus zosterae]